jgi:hypothetical protein
MQSFGLTLAQPKFPSISSLNKMYGIWEILSDEKWSSAHFQISRQIELRRHGKERKEILVVPTSIPTAVFLSMHFEWMGPKCQHKN